MNVNFTLRTGRSNCCRSMNDSKVTLSQNRPACSKMRVRRRRLFVGHRCPSGILLPDCCRSNRAWVRTFWAQVPDRSFTVSYILQYSGEQRWYTLSMYLRRVRWSWGRKQASNRQVRNQIWLAKVTSDFVWFKNMMLAKSNVLFANHMCVLANQMCVLVIKCVLS